MTTIINLLEPAIISCGASWNNFGDENTGVVPNMRVVTASSDAEPQPAVALGIISNSVRQLGALPNQHVINTERSLSPAVSAVNRTRELTKTLSFLFRMPWELHSFNPANAVNTAEISLTVFRENAHSWNSSKQMWSTLHPRRRPLFQYY